MIARGLLALALAAGVAHADVRTGVVVTGDAKLQPVLSATLEGWLRSHNREPFVAPLEADAINTIVDCMVIEDQSCARMIIDKRAKSDAVIFARIESTPAKRGGHDIAITTYWFVKGHDGIAERRVCEHCTPDQIKTTAEGMLKILATATEGQHAEGEPAEPPPPPVVVQPPPAPPPPVVVQPPPPPPSEPGPDRTMPIAVGAVGVVALGVSIGLLMHDDDGSAPTYRDTKPAGVVVGIGAVALIGLDVYLWMHPKRESGPMATATHDSALVGWAGRF
jgi:hypothetical protein